MSNQDDFGGLTSQTGSVGGGGDGSNHRDDRGIFFPEFDKWARINGMSLKTATNAKIDKKGISETFTLDIIFDDDAWRPSSTIIGNEYFPKVGSQHPTIEGCYLDNVTIKSYNNQHDHFRSTLDYKYPDNDSDTGTNGGTSGGGGGDSASASPLDEPFLINFTPNLSQLLIGEDLDGNPIVNPNGEPYEKYTTKVRLDGVCSWNQFDWDIEDTKDWVNIINKDTWTIDEYKFDKNTILLHYVVGNTRFFTNNKGRRIRYYEMRASISYNSEGWNDSADGTKVKQRRTGSFYYTDADGLEFKHPKDRNSGDVVYDLDSTGGLLTEDKNMPTSPNPLFDEFRLYELKTFNFVDLVR